MRYILAVCICPGVFRLLYARWWFTFASLSPGCESWWQSVGHVCCSRGEVSYDPADILSRFVLSVKSVHYPKSSSQSFWRNYQKSLTIWFNCWYILLTFASPLREILIGKRKSYQSSLCGGSSSVHFQFWDCVNLY